MGAGPHQSPDAKGACPRLLCNEQKLIDKCRGLAPAILQPAGAEGSGPGKFERGCQTLDVNSNPMSTKSSKTNCQVGHLQLAVSMPACQDMEQWPGSACCQDCHDLSGLMAIQRNHAAKKRLWLGFDRTQPSATYNMHSRHGSGPAEGL